MNTSTYTVNCPGLCGATSCGEAVTLHYGDFNTTTVSIDACTSLLAQGWTGPQVVDYKSRADRYFPAATTTVVRHRDGLVTFAG